GQRGARRRGRGAGRRGGAEPRKPGKRDGGERKRAGALRAPGRPASGPGGEPAVGALQVPSPSEGGSGLGIRTPVPLGTQESPAAGGRPPWDRPPPRGSAPPDPSRIARGETTWQPPTSRIQLPKAPVPWCVEVNNQLVGFALYDLDGHVWEYRKQRRGKLMLIDFWSTSCVPCLQTLPYLRQLQDRYGSLGLEVAGIAYEDRGTLPEQAKRVRA